MIDSHAEILSFREIQYAAKAHMKENLESYSFYVGGIVFILFAIAFELFMLIDVKEYDGEVIGVSLGVCVVVLFGVMLIKTSRDTKYTLHKERMFVKGRLEKVIARNPSGPNVKLFYIENCLLRLPPDGDFLCESKVGEYIEVSGVAMTRDNTSPSILAKWVSFFYSFRDLEADSSTLIVLNYNDFIDIDGVLKRHGIDYFKQHFWMNCIIVSLIVVPLVLLVGWFLATSIDVVKASLIFFGFFVAVIIFSIIIGEPLEKWINRKNNYGDTTHLERLSGKV